MVVDPSLEEELVMEGRLVVGMNVHQEVCVLQMNGGVPLLPDQVFHCWPFLSRVPSILLKCDVSGIGHQMCSNCCFEMCRAHGQD